MSAEIHKLCQHHLSLVKLTFDGECADCKRQLVDYECMINGDGTFFFWRKEKPEFRAESHPANMKNYLQMFPSIWVEVSR